LDRRKGIDYARRGLLVGSEDPVTLANAAQALASFDEDIGAMIMLTDRALVLNPSYARGWFISGVLRAWAGECEPAIECAETALRLSPHGRIGVINSMIGSTLVLARRFEAAIPKLLLAIQDEPNFAVPYYFLAASYAHLGRFEEAAKIISRCRAITTRVMPNLARLRKPEHRELVLSGLRLAAGETA
jgi:adenylate cyclase